MTSRPYKQEFKRHNHRRKKNHDYRAPCKYHITITKTASAPVFSSLIIKTMTPDGVMTDTTPLGRIINEEIQHFSDFHPEIQVYDYIVMPDHVHMLIRVKKRLDRPVGNAIGGLKSGISNRWRKLNGNDTLQVFDPDFNDRIIYANDSLDDVFKYIRHNPYRLAVRQKRRSFFQKERNKFIEKCEVQAYGNLFHLRNPFKYALIVHKADDDKVFGAKMDECVYFAANGGVIVSAFISPREKEIRREIEAIGGKIILIDEKILGDREKPARHDFDLCSEGRLLILTPLRFANRPKREHPSRSECLQMNDLALKVCTPGSIAIR